MTDNHLFLQNTVEGFVQAVRGKRLILFGAGGAELYRDVLDPHGLAPAYIVDNDFRKWYTRKWGVSLYPPEHLWKEDPSGVVVLITNNHPYQVMEQLEEKGAYLYYSSHLFLGQYLGRKVGALPL